MQQAVFNVLYASHTHTKKTVKENKVKSQVKFKMAEGCYGCFGLGGDRITSLKQALKIQVPNLKYLKSSELTLKCTLRVP